MSLTDTNGESKRDLLMKGVRLRVEAQLKQSQKEVDPAFIKNTEVFKISMKVLDHPKMADNSQYQTMLKKLEQFYVQTERRRKLPLE